MQIKLDKIFKSFGDKTVLHGVDLVIESNSFTTLLGPSGCGKTTLLRMIAGLETADSGEIYFDDWCVYSSEQGINISPEERNLAFVFQDFALWPHMTVFENVAFGLRARQDTHNLDQRVLAALDKVHLADFSQQKPGQLSGGQQQRVAFARAIAVEPQAILFDEPFSALDAILREGMRVELKNLAEELNFTSIFVTHDQLEAMSMSDRIAVISDGRIEQYASPEEIYRRPQTAFVANFVGDSNWLGDQQMFRPENSQITDSTTEAAGVLVKAEVVTSEFLGTGYKLHLNYQDRHWTMESSRAYPAGSQINILVDEDTIVTV